MTKASAKTQRSKNIGRHRSSRGPRRRDPPGPTGALGRDHAFPIVGIGASAGGLDAFKKLFSAMPADSGMAFVLIPHLDPTHESLMVELLAKQTAMPVSEARDGMPVESNHVYVIPPNADLTIEHRVLHVAPPPPRRGSQTAIDVFLRSLATDQRAQAIGIILSGTGSHGTLGILDIKAAGGMVMAQAPESAEHDQMPRSAIATGVVDDILPPEQMPQALLRYVAQLSAPAPDLAPEDLGQILLLLRARLKRDFRGYRRNMLVRRVRRRMGLCHADRMSGYVDYLRTHPDEVQALGKDLSIGVTAFFREPDAFQLLERVVIPELVQHSGQAGDGERPVRVWVPGCATGEEAYSVAMLFLEQFAVAKRPVNLQIFATDIDDAALEIARAGLYPDSIAADVAPERLQQFFVKTSNHRYQVSKPLRETITFAPQNVIGDAPFSKLDLVSCRNVLIYLEPDVQAKIVALFHFALLEGGYLVLGPAESIGPAADRFEPISKKWRVYRRIGAGRRDLVEIPILPAEAPRVRVPRHDERPRPAPAVAALLHRALLADFAPAAVLIDRRYEILSVQGPVVDYLEFPPGELTRDVLSMARSGLRTAIRGACQQAVQDRRLVIDAKACVKRQGAYVSCTVTARPVADAKGAAGLLLVTFQDRLAHRAKVVKKQVRAVGPRRADESTLVGQLDHELKATRDDLQGTIDELETSNEELKASHEEVMSMNEELQSTNEEMETSKEELQSLNEELSTVNSQLEDKVRELDTASNDMMNLLASTEIATVFLDADLRIKRFTPPTAKLLNLLATDLGRPFRDIAPRVTDPPLFGDCRRVLEQLTPVETVVRADDARAYLRRVLPYRTADNRIDGVVITWVDITERLVAEAESRRLSAVLRDSNDAIALLDLEGRISGWNRGARQLYGYTEAEARTMNVRDLVPELHRDVADDLVRRVGRGDVLSESIETHRITKDGRTRDISLTMTLLRDAAGRPDAIVTIERDVTDLKEEVAAKQAAQIYQLAIEHLPAGAVLREGGRLTMNRSAEVMTGYRRSELPTVDAWCVALHGDKGPELRPCYEMSGSSGSMLPPPVPLAITRKDGQTRHLELTVRRLDDTHELWRLLDMTERDQAERALRRSEDYLRSIFTTVAEAIITIDERGTIETFNPAAERMFGHTSAEVVGQSVGILMPQPYRDEHAGYIARYTKTGEARVIGIGREVIGLRKDGTTFPLDLSVSEIGRLQHFTGVLRDLSDRRKLEWRLAESQVEERRLMARELHDGMGGQMTGIGLLAQALQTQLAKTSSPLAAKAEDLVQSINDGQKQLRSIVRELMPVEAIPEGLMVALQDFAKQSETLYKVSCVFQCEKPVHFDDPTAARHVFRIVQEAVNNAVRHGQPAHVTIGLERIGPRLEIVVTDDGRGLKEIPAGHSGIGLASMRQRARLLGGDCSIQPREGGGTLVRCWIPSPSQGAQQVAARAARPNEGPRG